MSVSFKKNSLYKILCLDNKNICDADFCRQNLIEFDPFELLQVITPSVARWVNWPVTNTLLTKNTTISCTMYARGGPGFPFRRQRQLSGGRGRVPLTYDFAKISEKLYEIEKFLGHGGASLLDPPT